MSVHRKGVTSFWWELVWKGNVGVGCSNGVKENVCEFVPGRWEAGRGSV